MNEFEQKMLSEFEQFLQVMFESWIAFLFVIFLFFLFRFLSERSYKRQILEELKNSGKLNITTVFKDLRNHD